MGVAHSAPNIFVKLKALIKLDFIFSFNAFYWFFVIPINIRFTSKFVCLLFFSPFLKHVLERQMTFNSSFHIHNINIYFNGRLIDFFPQSATHLLKLNAWVINTTKSYMMYNSWIFNFEWNLDYQIEHNSSNCHWFLIRFQNKVLIMEIETGFLNSLMISRDGKWMDRTLYNIYT